MPSRESEVAAYLAADVALKAILTGGVYTASALGLEGINRTITPGAFDADGWLLPTGLVRGRADVASGPVVDLREGVAGTSQVIEIYVFAEEEAAIETAQDRIYALMQGHAFTGAWAAMWTTTTPHMREQGALANAWSARSEFQIVSMKRAA